jgi:Tfp pilus assembly protein PilF
MMMVRVRSILLLLPAALALQACGGGAADAPAAAADSAATAAADPMAEGLRLIQAGDGYGAVAIYREMLGTQPDHYGATYQLARALDLSGKPEEARIVWTRAFELAQQYQDEASITAIRERLAQPDTLSQAQRMTRAVDLLYREQDAAKAVELLREVLARTPDHYGAHYQIATALDKLGQRAEAEKYWRAFEPMARATNDQASLATVTERLAQR